MDQPRLAADKVAPTALEVVSTFHRGIVDTVASTVASDPVVIVGMAQNPVVKGARKLLDEEGVFAGVSSGAIASIAVRIAGELDEGNVVFIVCDDGWKYLSSGIYTKPVDEIANLDSTVWW